MVSKPAIRQKLRYPDLSYKIIGCAMEVHRKLGPGQTENFYHLALAEALEKKGISFQYKPHNKLVHRGFVTDEFEADLIIEDKIIVELKCNPTGFAPENYTQLICYLKCWGKGLGLLINFGEESLAQKRIPYDAPDATLQNEVSTGFFSALAEPEKVVGQSIITAVQGINEEYGTGYRDSTYKSLLHAEFAAKNIPCEQNPAANLIYAKKDLGTAEMNCLMVGQRCLLRVHAIRDRLKTVDHAIARSYLTHLDVSMGLIANFGRNTCRIIPIRDTTNKRNS